MIFGHEWYLYLAFFGIGAFTSAINSIAGGGSSVSIPLMIFCGLPPMVANGTNRIGLLFGNFASAYNLFRRNLLNVGLFYRLIVPTVIGSIAGIFFLAKISDRLFQVILSLAIFFVVIASNLKPNFLGKPPSEVPPKLSPAAFLGFLCVAIYGSIVQIGVGFVQILALSRYTGLDLLHVNALKNALTCSFLLVSTIGLVCMGKVEWGLAVSTSLGALCGGLYGSHLQCKKGNVFIRRVISVASLCLAIFLIKDLF